jgi:hypothetical protein
MNVMTSTTDVQSSGSIAQEPGFRAYKASSEIMDEIDDLRRHGRAPGYGYIKQFIGPTGAGKSMIIEEYARHFPVEMNGAHVKRRPVLFVKTPDKCTGKSILEAFLFVLDPAFVPSRNYTEAMMAQDIAQHIKRQGVELIILDEAQQLTTLDAYTVAGFFKYLANETKTPLIMAGLPSIGILKQANKQFSGRCRADIVLESLRWDDTDDKKTFRSIVRSWEESLSVKPIGFHLYEDPIDYRLFFFAEGLLRDARTIVDEAVSVSRLRPRRWPDLRLESLQIAWARIKGCSVDHPENPFAKTWQQADAKSAPLTAGDRSKARGRLK